MKLDRVLKKPLVVIAAVAMLSMPSLATAAVKNFMVVINGAQETPPNASTALGNGILTYDTATKTLCYYISFAGLTGGAEIAAHIHGPAAPGAPAGIILGLPLGAGKTACVVNPAAPFDKADLLKNLYYVNIHSAGFPAGEIRGQIFRIK
jgi:hypothetical protein